MFKIAILTLLLTGFVFVTAQAGTTCSVYSGADATACASITTSTNWLDGFKSQFIQKYQVGDTAQSYAPIQPITQQINTQQQPQTVQQKGMQHPVLQIPTPKHQSIFQ